MYFADTFGRGDQACEGLKKMVGEMNLIIEIDRKRKSYLILKNYLERIKKCNKINRKGKNLMDIPEYQPKIRERRHPRIAFPKPNSEVALSEKGIWGEMSEDQRTELDQYVYDELMEISSDHDCYKFLRHLMDEFTNKVDKDEILEREDWFLIRNWMSSAVQGFYALRKIDTMMAEFTRVSILEEKQKGEN